MSDESDPEEHEESESREIEFERNLSREEVADHFEAVADGLRDGSLSLTFTEETVELSPSERIEFEAEYEEDGDERELEFELEWSEREEAFEISSG
jgi:amphi-Trp domain-containing protein